MAEVFRMPRISDTMEEGTIVAWLKEVGDTVEAGDTIAEVETDKATMELDSYVDGVLLHIEVQEGTVPINGVIAVIGEEGEDWKSLMDGSNEPAETKAEEEEELFGEFSSNSSDAPSEIIDVPEDLARALDRFSSLIV